jgi:hypothetical protein
MILVKENLDQKAKKCSTSLTELPRKIIYIYFYTLLLLVFSIDATLALGQIAIRSIISKHGKDGKRGVTQSFWSNLVNCKYI